MINSVSVESDFDKIQCAFKIKVTVRVGLEGAELHIISATYGTSTANSILNGEKL